MLNVGHPVRHAHQRRPAPRARPSDARAGRNVRKAQVVADSSGGGRTSWRAEHVRDYKGFAFGLERSRVTVRENIFWRNSYFGKAAVQCGVEPDNA